MQHNVVNNDNNDDTYKTLVKIGLYNYKTEMKLDKGTAIPLKRVNQFFFGTELFINELNFLTMVREGWIFMRNKAYWIHVDKLNKYLADVDVIIQKNQSVQCCPYNYYKYIKQVVPTIVIPQHYADMIKSLDSFLEFLENKKTQFSVTVKHLIFPGSQSYINTEIADIINIGNGSNQTVEILFKFRKQGKPLFIRMSRSITTHNIIDHDRIEFGPCASNNFEQVYSLITRNYLMDSLKDFLINNIERVCGSYEFAELMVVSYLGKETYIFDIETVGAVIYWKDNTKESAYQKYFMEKYTGCYEIQTTGKILLNFEGINKFLLNITESDVINFEFKEQINDMYYKSMYELINSFELFYKR